MGKRAGITILILLINMGLRLFSQELSHQVLVPVAGITLTGTVEYTQTVGETAVEIFSADDFVLTQGFQQPRMIFRNETPPSGNGVRVYPNPAKDVVTVELFGDVSRKFKIEIINISGCIVISEKISFPDSYWDRKSFPVYQLSRGLYFVRIISEDGLINRTFKINKI